jgi:hypothetical protein
MVAAGLCNVDFCTQHIPYFMLLLLLESTTFDVSHAFGKTFAEARTGRKWGLRLLQSG